MHPLWKKAAAAGFLVFLGLWTAGGIRGSAPSRPQPGTAYEASAWNAAARAESSNPSQQFANNLKEIGLAKTPLPAVLDQADVERIRVHEKSAQLGTTTTAFDEDEALIRSTLTTFRAEVLIEKNGGILPQRRLAMEIGVHPDRFDALVEQLRTIGTLESVSVQQLDRTGDFRRLHAQRQSLKKHLESLLKLRGAKAPSIEDTLKVEQRIQEIEKELQSLGVQLGDLLGKESFYHIHLTLSEKKPGVRSDFAANLAQRLLQAFLWALHWWGLLVLGVGTAAAAIFSVKTLWPAPRT
jgi:hypothetical protein